MVQTLSETVAATVGQKRLRDAEYEGEPSPPAPPPAPAPAPAAAPAPFVQCRGRGRRASPYRCVLVVTKRADARNGRGWPDAPALGAVLTALVLRLAQEVGLATATARGVTRSPWYPASLKTKPILQPVPAVRSVNTTAEFTKVWVTEPGSR